MKLLLKVKWIIDVVPPGFGPWPPPHRSGAIHDGWDVVTVIDVQRRPATEGGLEGQIKLGHSQNGIQVLLVAVAKNNFVIDVRACFFLKEIKIPKQRKMCPLKCSSSQRILLESLTRRGLVYCKAFLIQPS